MNNRDIHRLWSQSNRIANQPRWRDATLTATFCAFVISTMNGLVFGAEDHLSRTGLSFLLAFSARLALNANGGVIDRVQSRMRGLG